MNDRSVRRQLAITGVVLLLLALMLSLLSVTAVAGEAAEEKCASIAFMDQGKLTADRDWLVAQEGKLPVSVHNCSTEVQTVTLSLQAFVPRSAEPEAARLKAVLPAHESEVLEPGETDDLMLGFMAEALTAFTETATYTGSLVATSHPGGDLIRREFELKVEVEEKEAGATVLGLGDLPKALETVTFQGTNYLPSIINPLLPAVFWVVAAFVLFGTVWLVLRLFVAGKKASGFAQVLIGLALLVVLVGVGWLVGLFVRTNGLGPEGGMVAVEPISAPALPESATPEPTPTLDPLSAPVLPETATPEPTPSFDPLGVVAAGDRVGAVGKRGERWEVAGLTRAGAYSGKMDLTPADDDKTKTTFEVNVADWWPFAFFTIALGVVVGYKLTQYYNKGRTAGQIKTEAAALWKRIAAEESQWQAEPDHAGKPYAYYSMVEAAKAQIDKIEGKLKTGEVAGDDGAEALLKALEARAGEFGAFRTSTVKLYEKNAELECLFGKESFGLTWQDVEAAEHSAMLLEGEALRDLGSFESGSTFSSRDTDVTDTIGWVKAVNGALADLLRWLDDAARLRLGSQSWRQELRGNLQSKEDAIVGAGRTILMAKNKEDVVTAHDEAKKAYLAMVALEKAAIDEALGILTKDEQFISFMAELGYSVKSRSEATQLMAEVAEAEPQPPTVSVACTVWIGEDKEQKGCQGDLDDLFEFAATLTFDPSDAKDYLVQWDFGDGSPYSPPISIPKDPSFKVTGRHQYSKPGTYTIRLLDVNGGDEKVLFETGPKTDPPDVTVNDLPGRSARRLTSFRLTDAQMTVVSGALAVATGMLALYTSTWGSPKDYFHAFLWGSVVSESAKAGAKIVKGLVDRKWPIPE